MQYPAQWRGKFEDDRHMRRLAQTGAVVLLAMALTTGGAARGEGNEEIFDPGAQQQTDTPTTPVPKKPAPAPTPALPQLVGNWARLDKGNPTCGRTTMIVRSSNGRLSGTTSTGGTVSQFKVRGRTFSFVEDYVDLLGNPVSIRYSGELSADGNSATASISGSWQDGCTSTFTRLN